MRSKDNKVPCKHCRTRITSVGNSSLNQYCDKPECQLAKREKLKGLTYDEIGALLKKTRQQTKKRVKEVNKIWRKDKKQLREKLKTLGEYEIEAKREFQHWVRLRDKDEPCISCGNSQTDQWDGGHYFKAELYSGLIFHTDNCNKQCKRCNNQLHGNESNYRIGLVKKIGEERVKWLEENKDRLRVYKFTKEELIAKKVHYKSLIKILQEK